MHLNLSAIFAFLKKFHIRCILVSSQNETTVWDRAQNMLNFLTGCTYTFSRRNMSYACTTYVFWTKIECRWKSTLKWFHFTWIDSNRDGGSAQTGGSVNYEDDRIWMFAIGHAGASLEYLWVMKKYRFRVSFIEVSYC